MCFIIIGRGLVSLLFVIGKIFEKPASNRLVVLPEEFDIFFRFSVGFQIFLFDMRSFDCCSRQNC